jgi:hypothetical protein
MEKAKDQSDLTVEEQQRGEAENMQTVPTMRT